MQHRPPLPVIIVVILLVISAGVYYFFFANRPVITSGLSASGTVETTTISIAPELSGKVVSVIVDTGQTVKAGDVLFKLDDSLLKAQRAVALAGLETAKASENTVQDAAVTAKAQYEIALNTSLTKDANARSQDWYKTQVSEFTLPQWYFNQQEQINAAQSVVDKTATQLDEARKNLERVQNLSGAADFISAENDLANAQASYLVAKSLHDRAWSGTNTDDLTHRQLLLLKRDAFLESKGLEARWVFLKASVDKDLRDSADNIFDDAKSALDKAQSNYADVAGTDAAKDILKARAEVSMAEENYYTALDFVRTLQTGTESTGVTAAQKAVDQSNAAATQAAAAVAQAQANLDLIDAQIAKLTVVAPSDGIILSRNVEPGEVVNPGSVVFTLGRLDELTLTVYIPEDRYGEIALGQTVNVTADSFPGKVFKASVTEISDKAEFTPRNVQTVEGRKTTVFAIKLHVEDPEGKLKPGMPADVVFK